MPAKFKRKMPVRNKIIETELGLERCCTKCDELYPLESDFFYKDGKDKAGRAKFTTQCKDCYKQSYRSKPSSRSKTEVTGDEHAIKREFERIEQQQLSNEQRAQDLDFELAYMRFETIARDIGVTVSDIINAQTKSPSAGTDGL